MISRFQLKNWVLSADNNLRKRLAAMISILPEPVLGFSTRPLPSNDGYQYTLTTLLGVFLRELQALYGPRDHSYTPLGIEFYGDIPQVWYPGNCRNVSIMLSDNAKTNPNKAIFQLAHEAVHLLAPTGGKNANVFEEGLATLYQTEISKRYGLNQINNMTSYVVAEKLTRKFNTENNDIVRKLRMTEPCISKWTPSALVSLMSAPDQAFAEALCAKFKRE